MGSDRMWAVVVGMALAGSAGCWKTVNTVERAEPLGRIQPVHDSRILTDPDVSGMAVICGVNESTVSGDLAKVQVDVYNSHAWTERFNYKFEWYDSEGMIVDSPMSVWRPQTMNGKEKVSLVSVAPNGRAKDFRLKIQESRGD